MLNRFNNVNQDSKNSLNTTVFANYSKLKLSLFFLPTFFLISIVSFLYNYDSLSVAKYVEIQKDYFYFINSKLSQFPSIVYNLTQFGDALIFLSLLTTLILYAPKVWESLFSATIVSAVFSKVLKDLFSVPRPAQIFDNASFSIIGTKWVKFSSLPSGHSITVFTILTVLLFAFMPKKWNAKIAGIFLFVFTGLLIAFTRVGVGAHHPIDVIIGSIIGYISGLSGIFISRKYKIWTWINNKKYYPIFIVLFFFCLIAIINKISKENLIVFYFSAVSLIFSLYKITYVYIKK